MGIKAAFFFFASPYVHISSLAPEKDLLHNNNNNNNNNEKSIIKY
jgi:hypothetical protein